MLVLLLAIVDNILLMANAFNLLSMQKLWSLALQQMMSFIEGRALDSGLCSKSHFDSDL